MIGSFLYTMAEKVSRRIYCMCVYHESIHYMYELPIYIHLLIATTHDSKVQRRAKTRPLKHTQQQTMQHERMIFQKHSMYVQCRRRAGKCT